MYQQRQIVRRFAHKVRVGDVDSEIVDENSYGIIAEFCCGQRLQLAVGVEECVAWLRPLRGAEFVIRFINSANEICLIKFVVNAATCGAASASSDLSAGQPSLSYCRQLSGR